MDMNALYDLKEMLCKELEEIAGKGEMSAGDLETTHKLTDTIKNIDKILMLEEDGGYSRAGDWEADMRGTYGRESSYANRGRHYVRGHYSRDGSTIRYGDGRGYSRNDAKERMLERLNEVMNDADENDREVIRRAMRQLENA